MQTRHFYILLGGNQGNEQELFNEVQSIIQSDMGEIIKVSKRYSSPAWGFESNDFINQAIYITSKLDPEFFMKKLLDIEKQMGRVRSKQGYTSRNIDIDILMIDNLILNSKFLSIPHPRLHERKFALIPLCEIADNQTHPVLNKTIGELLISCSDPSKVNPVK